MKLKYVLIGLLALVIFIFAYHFYAAAQAERQIGEAIRKQTEHPASSISVTYSALNVSPFKGDIRIEDLSVAGSPGLLSSRSVHLDMKYRDFLNIYLWGLQYGLEQLNAAQLNVKQPSYVDRSSFIEIKFNSLDLTLWGNAWDALVSLVNSTPAATSLSLKANGDALSVHIPDALPGTVKAEAFTSDHSYLAGSKTWWRQGEHRFKLNGILWTPPSSFQKQYGFFIQGFGYETDRIPADSLLFMYHDPATSPALVSASLFSGLFDARARSQLFINPDLLIESRLKDGTVDIINSSGQFDIFVQNLEQLMGLKLANPAGPMLRFAGPLNAPRFSLQQ